MFAISDLQNVLGINFTDSRINLIVLRREQGRIIITTKSSTELPAGIIQEGVIQEKGILADRLIGALRKLALPNWKGLNAILALPERHSYLHLFDLPANLDKLQVEAALNLEIENILPITVVETYSDFQELTSDSPAGKKRYLFAAVPKRMVDDYLDVLNRAELNPIVFNLEALSQGRALFANESLKDKAHLIVNLGQKYTTISSFHGPNIYASIVSLIGRTDFLTVAANKLQLSTEELEKKLLHPEHDAFTQTEKTELKGIFADLVARLSKEIKRAKDYYAEHHAGKDIEDLAFCGVASYLPIVTVALGEASNLPILSCCAGWRGHILVDDKEECSLYTAAFGAAILGLQKTRGLPLGINLLPRDFKQKLQREGLRALMSILQLLVGIFATTLLVSLVVVWATLSIEANSLHQINETTAGILKGERYAEIDELVNDFNKEVRVALQTDPKGKLNSKIIKDILEILPKEIKLNHFNWLGQDGVLEIAGLADTRDTYLAFRELLSSRSYVSNVEVPLSNIVKQRAVDFIIRFQLLNHE